MEDRFINPLSISIKSSLFFFRLYKFIIHAIGADKRVATKLCFTAYFINLVNLLALNIFSVPFKLIDFTAGKGLVDKTILLIIGILIQVFKSKSKKK